MNYTVVWRSSAEEELAAIWEASDDRNAVSAAAEEIDRRLARDPIRFGESRDPGERLAYYGPLSVYFHVDPQKLVVSVLAMGLASGSH